MATILIIGASRGIGLEAVRQALAAGYRVRALARGAKDMAGDEPGLERISADALDGAALGAALAGADAVLQCLGVRVTARSMLRPVTLFSRASEVLVSAMDAAGVRRLVAVTGFGTGESAARVSRIESLAMRLALGRIYDDKARQERIVRASGLDWTIVRPVFLTPGPRTGRYRVLVRPDAWRNGLIRRADVADFMLREVAAPTCIGETPVLAY